MFIDFILDLFVPAQAEHTALHTDKSYKMINIIISHYVPTLYNFAWYLPWSQCSMHRLLMEITRAVTNRITRAGNELHIAC